MTIIPVGPYRPDAAPGTQGVSPFLYNVTMHDDAEFGISYAPQAAFETLPTADSLLPDSYAGSLTAVTASGVYVLFIMSSTKIYRVSATGGLTTLGSGYNLPAGDKWSACQFGTKAIFTNKNDGMLQYDIELGGAITAISGAPKARIVRTIFDVLFALDCDGNNKLMRNSDFDYTIWNSGIAGYQPFADATELLGIEKVSDGQAIILQRNQIHIASKRSDALLYDLATLSTNEGAVNMGCIVPAGGAVYFIDTNGFKVVDGSGTRRIGLGKVDRTLIGPLTNSALQAIQGAYDPSSETIRWRANGGSGGPSGGVPDIAQATGPLTLAPAMFDYSIRYGEFVPSYQSTGAVFTAASPGYTMEDLDAFGTMDTISRSLDDRFWYGGLPQLAGLSGGAFGFFTGNPVDAVLATAILEFQQTSLATSIRTAGDETDVRYHVLTKQRYSDDFKDSDDFWMQNSGAIPVRGAGRYVVLEALFSLPNSDDGNNPHTTPPAWSFFRGFEIDGLASQGKR